MGFRWLLFHLQVIAASKPLNNGRFIGISAKGTGATFRLLSAKGRRV
jgi:hypothetical protein